MSNTSPSMPSTNSNIALLVDYENVAQPTGAGLAAIISQVSREGTVVLRRAYANWGRFSSHKSHLRDAGFEMIDVVSTHGKNSVDIKLVVDAMEIAFCKDHIDTFVIVSGDSDFIPLVTKLNELNRRAWLCVGSQSVSPTLAKFCFRMPNHSKPTKLTNHTTAKIGPTIPNNSPVPSLARPSVTLSPSQQEFFQLALQVCDALIIPPLPMNWLFAVVRRLDPQFDLTPCVGLGKRPHVRTLEYLQQLGLVKFWFDDQEGNYLLSVSAELQALQLAPEEHPNFESAVEVLQHLAAACKEHRFQLKADNPLTRRKAFAADDAHSATTIAAIGNKLTSPLENDAFETQLMLSFE